MSIQEPKHDIYLRVGIGLSVILAIASLCASKWVYNQHDNLEILVSSLAFIWLVVGYHQNNKAIQLQAKEMKDSVNEFKQHSTLMDKQLSTLNVQRVQQQRESYIKLYEIFFREVASHALRIGRHIHLTSFRSYNGRFVSENYVAGHGDVTRFMYDMAGELHQSYIENPKDIGKGVMEVSGIINKIKELYEAFQTELRDNCKDDVFLCHVLLSENPILLLLTTLKDIREKEEIKAVTGSRASSRT